MKKYLFMFFAVAAIAFTSCKKDASIQMDAAVQHIPSDASQVTVVRIPKLMEKMDFEKVRDMDFYQQMIKEAANQDQLMGKILYDPAESGINIKQNAYFISDINPNNAGEMLNGVMFNIGDPAKFAELVKSTPMSINKKAGDGYQYGREGNGFLAWNDEIAFAGQSRGDIDAQLDKVFNLGDGASVLSSNAFEKTGSSSSDISFVLNSDAVADMQQMKQAQFLLGWDEESLKGNHINGDVDFDEKKMKVNADIILKKDIEADLGMPFKSSISTDFSPYIPKDNLTGVFTFGLDTKGLLQLLKEKNALGLINSFSNLDQMGINLDEIAAAIDGDMFLAIQKAGDNSQPAGIFGLSVDGKKFQPLLDKMVEIGIVTPRDGGVYQINDESLSQDFNATLGGRGEAMQPVLIMKDNILFASADPTLIQGIKDGGLPKGSRLDKSIYKEISKGFLGGRGFPEQLKGLVPGAETGEIEAFLFNLSDGNIQMEVTSKKDGNFLKSMIESADAASGINQ